MSNVTTSAPNKRKVSGSAEVPAPKKNRKGDADFEAVATPKKKSDSVLQQKLSDFKKVLSIQREDKAHGFITSYASSLLINTTPDGAFEEWLENIEAAKVLDQCIGGDSFEPLLEAFEAIRVYTRPTLRALRVEIDPEAVHTAWHGKYEGDMDRVLLTSIIEDNRSAHYTNTGVILQSSGYGKSRTVYEVSARVATIPINIRPLEEEQKEAAYPPADPDLLQIFNHFGEKFQTKSSALAHIHRFFQILFTNVAHELDFIPFQTPQNFAAKWRSYLQSRTVLGDGSEATVRDRLYRKVKDEYSKPMTKEELAEMQAAQEDDMAPGEGGKGTNGGPGEKTGQGQEEVKKKPGVAGKAVDELGILMSKIPSDSSIKLLIYIDEAQTIAETKVQDFSVYELVLKALNDYREHPVFSIFLSTASHAGDLAKPSRLSSSARMIRAPVLAPYTEMPFDCHPALAVPIQPDTLWLGSLKDFGFMVRFGRPLFWSLYESYIQKGKSVADTEQTILDLAIAKLTALNDREVDKLTDEGKLAVLDVLLNLEYYPFRTASLLERMVASHMRTAFSAPKSRDYLYSGYPSEPILAEAALTFVWSNESKANRASSFMTELFTDLDTGASGAIDMGQRGENVGKLLLLRAYMAAVKKDKSDFRDGCSLLSFLECLFSERFQSTWEACLPDNVEAGDSLKEKFKNSWVRFTHFVRSGDPRGMSTAMAWVAFVRGMAVIGWHSQVFVDALVPVLLDKTAKISEQVMSGILVQFKRRAKPGSRANYAIDANRVKFFPSGQRRLADDRRPFISLVMELGISASLKSSAVGTEQDEPEEVTTKVDDPSADDSDEDSDAEESSQDALPDFSDDQNRRARSSQARHPQRSSADETPSKLVAGPPAKKVSKRNAARTRHPRYNIFAYGCTNTVYSCISHDEREKYVKLLRTRDMMLEHPREKTLDYVKQMKPFWVTGQQCFGWVFEPFLCYV